MAPLERTSLRAGPTVICCCGGTYPSRRSSWWRLHEALSGGLVEQPAVSGRKSVAGDQPVAYLRGGRSADEPQHGPAEHASTIASSARAAGRLSNDDATSACTDGFLGAFAGPSSLREVKSPIAFLGFGVMTAIGVGLLTYGMRRLRKNSEDGWARATVSYAVLAVIMCAIMTVISITGVD